MAVVSTKVLLLDSSFSVYSLKVRELVFATRNPNKMEEIRQMLPGGICLLSLDDIGCREDIPETAPTLEGNARLKAEFVRDRYGYDCIADDTGLEVEALGGEPGVYSARYAGPQADAPANTAKLLEALGASHNRKARFRTVIALTEGDACRFFEGIAEGEILQVPRGSGGFGYDPVFRPLGHSRSFAEFSREEKNSISHRGKAFRALQAYIKAAARPGPA